MKPVSIGSVVCLVLALAWCEVASAEVFVLSNGGRVVGELLNSDQLPRQTYVIKVQHGGEVTLTAAQVKQILHQRPEELEYEKICPRYGDTIEEQWALAEWCRERYLVDQRKKHLERIIQLDPDHEKARRALGQTLRNGKWMTQKQWMTKQGYRLYRGRYRLPQEIELMERQRKIDTAESEWKKKLSRWRGWLGSDKHAQACREISLIDDPYAVKALAYAMEKDSRQQARVLFVEPLAKIGTPQALQVLAERSLEDPVEEVRLTCLDYLEDTKNPDLVAYYVGKLKSKDNRMVNRAGIALSYVNDPSAVKPLIDALITVHKYKIVKGSPGQMSTTFSNSGAGGLAMGGGAKIVKVPHKNQAVLDALVRLTGGVSFSFDTAAWNYWYTAQRKRGNLDIRRD